MRIWNGLASADPPDSYRLLDAHGKARTFNEAEVMPMMAWGDDATGAIIQMSIVETIGGEGVTLEEVAQSYSHALLRTKPGYHMASASKKDIDAVEFAIIQYTYYAGDADVYAVLCIALLDLRALVLHLDCSVGQMQEAHDGFIGFLDSIRFARDA